MTNRTLRLIKYELFDWGRSFLMGFGIIALWIVPLILLSVTFGWEIFRSLNIIFTIGKFVFIMWISGIVAGAEVSGNVRKGISRIESFVSKMSSALVGCFIISGPFMMLLDLILTFLPGNIENGAGEWSIAILGAHFLICMATFCMGFFMAILWQRIGWLPALAIICGFVILAGVGIAGMAINIPINFIQEVVDIIVIGSTNIDVDGHNIGEVLVSIGTILVFGAGSFLMIKKVPVSVK